MSITGGEFGPGSDVGVAPEPSFDEGEGLTLFDREIRVRESILEVELQRNVEILERMLVAELNVAPSDLAKDLWQSLRGKPEHDGSLATLLLQVELELIATHFVDFPSGSSDGAGDRKDAEVQRLRGQYGDGARTLYELLDMVNVDLPAAT